MTARRKALVTAAVLLFAAHALYDARRRTIVAIFGDGPPRDAPELPQPPRAAVPAASLVPAPRVRVLLLDGLSLDAARRLPQLSRFCTGGLDLVVDMGFPTVSLPVQHVLWTGLAQRQSGVMYRMRELAAPPPGSLPARVPGSRAVVESHLEIARSFGFADIRPAGAEEPPGWRETGFAAAAAEAVASPARLVFVHVLRIDEAGHRHGRDSREYFDAAASADALVVPMLASAGTAPPTRWFVLSDHGHRARGGHGDAEGDVRLVRACVGGAATGGARLPARGRAHLVDVSRAIADSLGLAPEPRAPGRPLAFALANPAPGATLPRPPALRRALAAMALALALAALAAGIRRAPWALPWWLPVAYVAVVVAHGVPTLSNPVVWSRVPVKLLVAAWPALAPLWIVTALAARRIGVARACAVQIGVPLLAVAAVFALSAGYPPVVPLWTAHAMALCALTAAASLALVPLALAAAALSRSDRPSSAAPRGKR